MDALSPAPPQRQSCDRCHRQKLRCTREKNSNGGVCDRCLGRRTQCVYSFSLPKGRPSSYRRPDESANKNTSETNESGKGDGKEKMIMDITRVGTSATNEDSILSDPMDTSVGASSSVGTWSQFNPLKWDDTQLGMDWNNHESSQFDTVLAALSLPGDRTDAQEELVPSQSTRLPYSQSSRHPTVIHSGSESSNLARHGGATDIDGKKAASSDSQSNWPDSVIAQLSELVTYLSAVRHSTSALAKAALSSSCCFPNGSGAPLIDAAAFKSVGQWLAHGQGSNHADTHTSVLDSVKFESSCSDPSKRSEIGAGQGILHEVFSASHRMLEILRRLQKKNGSGLSGVPTPSSVSRSSTALSAQNDSFGCLTEGPWSSAQPYSSQSNITHTVQINRHLVLACEALLLEIYMAILTALQHDISHHASGNTTSLGDVRLAMTVQLCSFLIERQQQAVDTYLAPRGPHTNGTMTPKSNVSASQQPILAGGVAGAGEAELLRETKNQLQGRLARLRHTLQYT